MAVKHILMAAAFLGMAAILPSAAGAGEASDLNTAAHNAMASGDWQGAADALNKLVVLEPRWTNFEALGDSEFNLGHYQEAFNAFNTAIVGARADKVMPKPDLNNALGAMYLAKGHSLVQLNRFDEALAAYNSSIKYAPNPGQALYAICTLAYNNPMPDVVAVEYCDKAIAADPKLADAYFLKASIQMSQATPGPDKKMVFPPGTQEAVEKYLELAPDGSHAQDAQDMLTALKAR